MKKIFALLLAAAMMCMFCTFAVTAFAEGSQSQEITLTISDYAMIHKVKATVVLPAAGKTVDDSLTVENAQFFKTCNINIYETDDNGNEGTAVRYETGYTYKAGQKYKISVNVQLNDSFRIADDAVFTINGMNATKTYSNTYAEFYIIYTAEVTTPTWTLNIPADVSVTYPVEYINLGEASITDVSNFTAGHIYAFMRYDGLFKKTDDSTKTIPFKIGTFSTNEDCRIGDYGVTASNDNGPVSFGYTNYSALQITIKRNDIAAAESGVYKTTVIYSSAFVAD